MKATNFQCSVCHQTFPTEVAAYDKQLREVCVDCGRRCNIVEEILQIEIEGRMMVGSDLNPHLKARMGIK